MQAIQKDQKHELQRSLKQNESVIATNGSSSNKKFNEAEFFERMKQFEESRSKTNTALRIRHEQEQLKEVTPRPQPFFSLFLLLSHFVLFSVHVHSLHAIQSRRETAH
jgi:hypothetical protein